MLPFLRTFKRSLPSTNQDDLPDSVRMANVESTKSDEYDPFKERRVEQPTTKLETMMNFLKAVTGMGMYSMPLAFSYTGLLTGVIATIVTAFFITHCVLILLRCSYILCRKSKRPSMTYPEVVEASFVYGPAKTQNWAKFMKLLASFTIALTYFGAISVYTLIISENFEQVIRFHFGIKEDIRIYILCMWIPLVLLCWIPDLKQLAPLSTVSNIFTLIGLVITFYYCLVDMPINERPIHTSFQGLTKYFGISFVAMETIGIILPLENKMQKPEQMIGAFGVVNISMTILTIVCAFLGFVGFAKYGKETQGSITLNLPMEEVAAQTVKILVAVAVFFTTALLFYIVLELVWNELQHKITRRKKLINYVLRTALITAAVLTAVAVPTIGPFISLIGACFFSVLGLIFPVGIEMFTFWDDGFGKWNWMIWKNLVIGIFGIFAMVFGSIDGVRSIANLYKKTSEL